MYYPLRNTLRANAGDRGRRPRDLRAWRFAISSRRARTTSARSTRSRPRPALRSGSTRSGRRRCRSWRPAAGWSSAGTSTAASGPSTTKPAEVLWEINLGSAVTGFPISYAVGGRQYVAVSTGNAGTASGFTVMTPEIRPGAANNLFVFALPERE